MKLTELEKQALQLLVDYANEIDEDNGIITYFCSFGVNENQIKGFRGVCSSLIKKNIICITDNAYVSATNIPVDNEYKIDFDKLENQ